MYINREAITLASANKLLDSLKLKSKKQTIKVEESLGYYLAQEIHAPFDFPPFRRSGYDGYGILAEDDNDFPKKLEVLAEIGAGETFTKRIKPGQTVRIMTGAEVPPDVDKVIMLEQTRKCSDNHVEILSTMKHSNITPVGEEFVQGEKLLELNTLINAGTISLLSAFGYDEVIVWQKPQVAILTTGSELLQPGEPLQPGKIFNSNGPLIKALVEENGGEVAYYGGLEDQLDALEDTIQRLTEEVSLILTTGGVSVGDYDFMAVVAKQSDQLLFNKLAMRPGSPTTAFVKNRVPIIALSGNPGACFTGFFLLVEPLLRKFLQQDSRIERRLMPLAIEYTKTNSYDRYLRGKVIENKVMLAGSDQSSALGNLHLTECLFKIPHDQKVVAGTEVEVWRLPCK
ncbi:molybdopterin molybdotransferase MoeA [Enterococcus sp. AZ109]|uniref:molybdopterin molybdotransferase MoeA n=1 Tax=Enterococcus sp. AZ109 TaxID=2774634 RepID=UPI003F230A1E